MRKSELRCRATFGFHWLTLLWLYHDVASTAAISPTLFVPNAPAHQGRRHSLPSSPPLRSYQCPEDSNNLAKDAHIFLRFSPLIGGPALLPLHVEVIVADSSSDSIEQEMDAVRIRKTNNISSTLFPKGTHLLHRFDFLPESPTDPATLLRLLTLRGVPGRLRYRRYKWSNIDETDDSMKAEKNRRDFADQDGITILFPVGSLERGDDIVSAAKAFQQEYSNTSYKELQILGGKNCLSFALDLLSHVGASPGIETITRLNKLDIE